MRDIHKEIQAAQAAHIRDQDERQTHAGSMVNLALLLGGLAAVWIGYRIGTA